MSDLPHGFQAGPLYCFVSGPLGGGRFAYIPGDPGIDRNGDTPRASLVSFATGASLSLETVWQATPTELAAARAAIAAQYPDLGSAADAITLSIADLSDVTATLTLSPRAGDSIDVGPQASMGAPSYRTVFSARLDTAVAPAAEAALAGETGVMRVAYAGTLTLQESATARLTGNLVSQIAALAPPPPPKDKGFSLFGKKPAPIAPPPPPPSLDACLAALSRAEAAGEVTLARDHGANVPADVRTKVEDKVRTAAAQLLQRTIAQQGAGARDLTALTVREAKSASVPISFAIRASADLATRP